MRKQGRESGSWGMKVAADGWHTVCFEEGIGYLEKDGEIIKDKKTGTYNLIVIPAKTVSDDEDQNGISLNTVINEGTDFGEQKIVDILAATGLFPAFEKNFPGDISIWDKKVMDAVKSKLPGKFAKFRTETSKDGKYTNVVEFASMKTNVDDKPKNKKEEPKVAAKAADDWD
jgi:hypothetical protein